MDLGKVGVWWIAPWRRHIDGSTVAAAEREDLDHGALWSSGSFEPGLANRFEPLLSTTTRFAVASGMVSIGATSAADIARTRADLDACLRVASSWVVGRATLQSSRTMKSPMATWWGTSTCWTLPVPR